MHFLNKINFSEKYNKACLFDVNCSGKFCRLLFPMHVLYAFNILPVLFLASSCSSNLVISKLKQLQPKNITDPDKNQSLKLEINYPIKIEDGIFYQDHYSAQTFALLIFIVLIFCFLNSEYPGKLFRLFRKK